MDLKIFFDSLLESDFADIKDRQSLFHHISIFTEKLPNWREADLAIIGVKEVRGNTANKGAENAADEIRKKLFRLIKGTGNQKIVDLGNLRNGQSLEDTYLRLKEVCEALLDHRVVPIIIGGTHDVDYGQYLAFEHANDLISVLNIDSKPDLEPEENENYRCHGQKIILHEPNFLFNYAHLGYQTYLSDADTINTIEKLSFDHFRLGIVQEKLHEMEPLIRDADMLSFDISAIKLSDAPGNAHAEAFGLTGQEACQLSWYAGMSYKMASAGFYEFNPELDFRNQTASVVATMIWYFIEGFYHRESPESFESEQYFRYVVSLSHDPHELIFFKNKRNEKWWMEVPYPITKTKYSKSSVVPCSYQDYLTATTGEIPDRWLQIHTKLI